MSPSMIQHVKCLACNSLVSLVNVDEWWMCKIGKTIQPSKTCWNQVTWTWMDCMVTACSYQRTSQTRSASTTSCSISPILTIRKPEGLLAFSQTLQAPTMKQQLLLTISYVAPLVKAFTCCQPVADLINLACRMSIDWRSWSIKQKRRPNSSRMKGHPPQDPCPACQKDNPSSDGSKITKAGQNQLKGKRKRAKATWCWPRCLPQGFHVCVESRFPREQYILGSKFVSNPPRQLAVCV